MIVNPPLQETVIIIRKARPALYILSYFMGFPQSHSLCELKQCCEVEFKYFQLKIYNKFQGKLAEKLRTNSSHFKDNVLNCE